MIGSGFIEFVVGATSVVSLAIGLRILWANYRLGYVFKNIYLIIKHLGDEVDWPTLSQNWHRDHDARVAGVAAGEGYHVPHRWRAEVSRIAKAAIRAHEKARHGG